MAKIVNIRNIPARLHSKLKARAASAGVSLSKYMLEELRRIAERPTINELRARVKRQRRK